MKELLFGAISALWLGILTSISPCPLATNIAAISFIGNRLSSGHRVIWSGFLYTVGRMIAYLALGIITVAGIMSIPGVANFLQQYMNKLLGPILIIVGLILLELIRINLTGWSSSTERAQKTAERGGILGAGLLGMFFALSFCPISAALFFGSLIPLSVKHNSMMILPSLYGLGTGIPVMLFAILIALGTRAVGKAFNMLTKIEWWARRITGIIFIAVGIYYSLVYLFGVL